MAHSKAAARGSDKKTGQHDLPPRSGPSKPFGLRDVFKTLGPGLITGAADDDVSRLLRPGIGTYSQTGAQLGYGASWTMVLTFPLMVAI